MCAVRPQVLQQHNAPDRTGNDYESSGSATTQRLRATAKVRIGDELEVEVEVEVEVEFD